MNLTIELDNTLSTFTNKLVDINNYQSFVKDATKRSFNHYQEQIERTKELDIGDMASANRLFSRDIENGDLLTLGGKNNSYDDLVQTVELHNNKQYQWLLVEAYEAFEDYINELYAYIGWKDNTFWVAKDFGNISIDELEEQDLEWFKKRVQAKQGTPESIYKQFRLKMKILKLLEKKNSQNIDYNFKIILIAKLRHIVVHNRGVIKDLDKFIETIFSEIGISQNGQNAEKYKSSILFYIGTTVDSENIVLLLEREHELVEGFPLMTYHDRLGNLIKELASYSILLRNLTQKYLSGNENLKQLVTSEEEYRKFFSSSDLYGYLK